MGRVPIHEEGGPTVILDLVAADEILLAYKRGEIERQEARRQLFLDCGYPEHLIDPLILRADDTSLEQMERELG